MIPRAHHEFPLGASEQHKWFPVRSGANDKYLDQLDARRAEVIRDNVHPLEEKFGYHAPI
jgi:hypothetical protein